MRAALIVLALSGCGAASSPGGGTRAMPSATPAPPARSAPEPALELGAMVITRAGSSAPFAVLDGDGTVHHARCALRLMPDGRVLDGAGATLLSLRDDAVVDASGEPLFELRDERLVRADGQAAFVEGNVLRVESAPSVELRLEGVESPARRRTALVLIAALSVCEG